MTEEEAQRKREEREAWLGGPVHQHGGEYRAPKSDWVSDLGCCGVEVFGSFAVLAFVVPLWLLWH